MLRIVLAVFSLFVLSEAVSQTCMTNSDCGVGQCCNNYNGPLQVSKRRRDLGSLLLPQLIEPEKQVGHCESYKSEGDYCSSIETMNGHCGCDIHKGLSCQFHPPTTLQPLLLQPIKAQANNKRMINPLYGSFKCTQLLLS